MYRLWRHIKRTYVFYLFIAAEVVAINNYANSTEYTREKMVYWATDLSGWFDRRFIVIGDYFRLQTVNRKLSDRVVELENMLAIASCAENSIKTVNYSRADVVSNTVARPNNYFVINRGSADGVAAGMAVLSIDGAAVGYVVSTTKQYAVCMSIVNRDFKVGGQVKNKEFFGQVVWNGGDARYASMIDVPRYADIVQGDTIQTIYSTRFPKGVFIGVVSQSEVSKDGISLNIELRLGADMARLSNVLLIENPERKELEEIMQ